MHPIVYTIKHTIENGDVTALPELDRLYLAAEQVKGEFTAEDIQTLFAVLLDESAEEELRDHLFEYLETFTAQVFVKTALFLITADRIQHPQVGLLFNRILRSPSHRDELYRQLVEPEKAVWIADALEHRITPSKNKAYQRDMLNFAEDLRQWAAHRSQAGH